MYLFLIGTFPRILDIQLGEIYTPTRIIITTWCKSWHWRKEKFHIWWSDWTDIKYEIGQSFFIISWPWGNYYTTQCIFLKLILKLKSANNPTPLYRPKLIMFGTQWVSRCLSLMLHSLKSFITSSLACLSCATHFLWIRAPIICSAYPRFALNYSSCIVQSTHSLGVEL